MLTRMGMGRSRPAIGFDDRVFDQMFRLFGDLDRGFSPAWQTAAAMPRIDLVDAGAELKLFAELPGFSEQDVDITIERNRLTLRGQRKLEVPEGYRVRRSERGDLAFARSITLPCRVDADGVEATLEHGVLRLRLPKAPEEQPRQITIKKA